MSANVKQGDARIRKLEGAATPVESVTPEDVGDPTKLAEILTRVLAEQAASKRRFVPRRVDFERVAFAASAFLVQHRFPHRFGGQIRWWLVDWVGGVPPVLVRLDDNDPNTLTLLSNAAGYGTIRIEEAG